MICAPVMNVRMLHSRYLAEKRGSLRRYCFAVVILEFRIVPAYSFNSSPPLRNLFPPADTTLQPLRSFVGC